MSAGSQPAATAGRAMVASGHPEVSRAALRIMRRGGNAFDAAVGGGFASAVAEPALTSLGGGGFLLARNGEGATTLFDFFTNTPGLGRPGEDLVPHFFPVTVRFAGSDQEFNIGLGSVAVPGNLKGFLHVHQRLGRLPLAEVVAPAVELARDGIRLRHQQAHFLRLLRPIMTMSDQGRRLFEPQGKYLSCGDLFRNPELADFLARLDRGSGEDFYHGKLASRIEADMTVGQGLLTAKDLAAFQVVERQPLACDYRGLTLLTNPPPSLGGTLICQALSLLGRFALAGFRWGEPAHLLLLAMVSKTLEEERDSGRLAQPSFLRRWREQAGERIRLHSRGTTHLSVVDRQGNVASMTTSNGEGSGYIVPGTGIMLNNMMGEDDLHPEGFHTHPPGQRVASMMAPSLLLAGDQVRLVIGSGGSKRIRTAIHQVVSHLVDFGLDLPTAVKAPRLHWDGTAFQVEPGFSDQALAAVRELGPVNVWRKRDVYFGGVHAVAVGRGGAGDPRRGGDAREEPEG